MNVIRYEPWGVLNRLHQDVDRLFSARLLRPETEDAAELSDWVPAVDIKEEDERFVIRADVPGVDPKDLDIAMEDGVLSLRGERETQTETTQHGIRRGERVSGRFFRRFTLPDTTDAQGISADYRNGVVQISIPKQPRAEPRRIQVKTH